MDQCSTVYFAYLDDRVRPIIGEMLHSLNCEVPLVTNKGQDLIDRTRQEPPDVLISSLRLDDMDGVRALIECSYDEPIPSIIVAKRADEELVERAMQDHVMAYLVEPVTRLDLKASIFLVQRRFEQFQALREENKELRAALDARKWVERAKGILMKQKEIDEPEAFRMLQKLASTKRKKMLDVARIIVEADGLLGDELSVGTTAH